MSVGLPGTGVGAAFYLLSALWAPVRSMLRRGDRRSRGAAIALLALGIIAAVALATAAIALVLPPARMQVVTIDARGDSASWSPSMLLMLALLSPFGTLALLLAIVRIGAAVMARTAARRETADIDAIDVDVVDDRLEVAS